MSNPNEIFETFLESMESCDIDLILQSFTDQSSWQNVPHPAAVGISEKTDATVLVVSEESGKISYIKNGEFVSFTSNDNLIEIIEEDLS